MSLISIGSKIQKNKQKVAKRIKRSGEVNEKKESLREKVRLGGKKTCAEAASFSYQLGASDYHFLLEEISGLDRQASFHIMCGLKEGLHR